MVECDIKFFWHSWGKSIFFLLIFFLEPITIHTHEYTNINIWICCLKQNIFNFSAATNKIITKEKKWTTPYTPPLLVDCGFPKWYIYCMFNLITSSWNYVCIDTLHTTFTSQIISYSLGSSVVCLKRSSFFVCISGSIIKTNKTINISISTFASEVKQMWQMYICLKTPNWNQL